MNKLAHSLVSQVLLIKTSRKFSTTTATPSASLTNSCRMVTVGRADLTKGGEGEGRWLGEILAMVMQVNRKRPSKHTVHITHRYTNTSTTTRGNGEIHSNIILQTNKTFLAWSRRGVRFQAILFYSRTRVWLRNDLRLNKMFVLSRSLWQKYNELKRLSIISLSESPSTL